MKVGLLTFHDAINYGAVLQAVALNRALTKICNEQCTLIDYSCKSIDEMYKIKCSNPVKLILMSGYQMLKRKSFRSFVKRNCKMTDRVNEQSITKYADKFDAWVVGSDQVWNGNITGHDANFLLRFVRNGSRRISYAASLGNYQIPENELSLFHSELKKYGGISVREPAGAEVLQHFVDFEVGVHLDPTLLLDRDEWSSMAKKPNTKNKYVFIYASGDVNKIEQQAQKIATKTGMNILYMGSYNIPNGRKLSFVSPEEWLGYIENAEYVLTNSFHGTVFSIIFNKLFSVDLGKMEIRNGKEMHHNDRAENLLNILGLQNREIDYMENHLDEAPNWETRDRMLLIHKEKAIEYLRKALNE